MTARQQAPAMSGIVERVAAAIDKAARSLVRRQIGSGTFAVEYPGEPPFIGTAGECEAYGSRRIARAALAALREPDEAMWAAGGKATDIASHDDPGLVWMRMLDAALGAPPAGKEGGYSAPDAKAGGKG